jgi:hypothetical protein
MTTKLNRFIQRARELVGEQMTALMGLIWEVEGLRESFQRQDGRKGTVCHWRNRPQFFGSTVNCMALHGFAFSFCAISGLGTVGAFLSVPLTMALIIAFQASPQTRPIAVLLGPEVSPTETCGDEEAGSSGSDSADQGA